MEHELSKKELKDKLLSGRAIFTAQNTEANTHRTFKINKAENGFIFFVKLLVGPNNNDNGDYEYIGHINTEKRILKTKNKAFKWLWPKIVAETLPPQITIHHEGKCLKCSRRLTDPESIKLGIGPICRKT